MYEARCFIAESVNMIETEAEGWSWVEDLLKFLEAKFTARDPSVRDQGALLVAITKLVQGTEPDMPTTIEGAAKYILAPLGLTFKTDAEIRWFPDSPDAGSPLCICSYCEEVITEEDAPAIRLFDNKREARFHTQCFLTSQTYNLIPGNAEKE
jgi:hypothetical protein